MIKTIESEWLRYFSEELQKTERISIISPFITDNVVRHLFKNFKGKKIQIITKYNLNDFRSRISSLSALKQLIENGANIRGIKNLHSKLYLFDQKSVIIASANFTNGGFFLNREFGVMIKDPSIIADSDKYFKSLWNIDTEDLSVEQIEFWSELIKSTKATPKEAELPDFGKSYEESVLRNRKYFIKFFGKNEHRESLNYNVRDEIEYGCCHYALSFSRKKDDRRPRKYRDGDIVFMAKMTHDDYAIFGKGITYAHNDMRDIAGPEDQNHVDWIYDWPILVRVKNTEFIDSTLQKCPKMSELINDLDYESFDKTYIRHLRGESNIRPWKSLQQKADIQLSKAGALWLENRFQTTLNQFGKIPESFIQQFYNGIEI